MTTKPAARPSASASPVASTSPGASHRAVTKDPICGMVVDPKTAPHAEQAGKTSYFCSAACRTLFVDQHASKTTHAKTEHAAKAAQPKAAQPKAADHGKD